MHRTDTLFDNQFRTGLRRTPSGCDVGSVESVETLRLNIPDVVLNGDPYAPICRYPDGEFSDMIADLS